MPDLTTIIIIATLVLILGFGFLMFAASRYRRCASDKILVVYGKVGTGGRSARCYHGGATLVWPIIQDYQYLDLTPIPMDIELRGALSQQNIRVNTPSTFTVGVSTEPGIMENAAERLLGLSLPQIRDLARDLIFGQMRVVIATMPIEEINADRDKLIANIYNGVEVELKKVGLRLINVNIQDITDESGYIDALGREAAARAINDAKIKVSEQDRDGAIGAAAAERDQRVSVAEANARAVEGENTSAIEIAQSAASRREAEAEAERRAAAAEKVKSAQALQEAYAAQQSAEHERAKKDQATQYANVVVPAEIEKQRIETLAEAEAEKVRRHKKGEADGRLAMLQAEAEGLNAMLTKKADGLEQIVGASGGKPELAALLMVTEELPELVKEQVRAISNLKIDSVTVWENGGSDGKGSSTANFVKGLVGALPPLHQLTKNVGVQLPEYLGTLTGGEAETAAPAQKHSPQKKDLLAHKRESILRWVHANHDRLTSFDLNADDVIDDFESGHAVECALTWVGHIEQGKNEFFYAHDSSPSGPHGWSKIKELAQQHNGGFVSYAGSKYWMPIDLLQLALNA